MNIFTDSRRLKVTSVCIRTFTCSLLFVFQVGFVSSVHGGTDTKKTTTGKYLEFEKGKNYTFAYDYFTLSTRGAGLYQREFSYNIQLAVETSNTKNDTTQFTCGFTVTNFATNDDSDTDGLIYPQRGTVTFTNRGSLVSATIQEFNRAMTEQETEQIKNYRLSDTYLFRTYLRFSLPTIPTVMNIGDRDTNTVRDTNKRQTVSTTTYAERFGDTTIATYSAEVYSFVTAKDEYQKVSRDEFKRRVTESEEGQEIIWWSDSLSIPVHYVLTDFSSRHMALIEPRRRTSIYGSSSEKIVSLTYLDALPPLHSDSHTNDSLDEANTEESLMQTIPSMDDK